jgi:hypothetical protein
LLLALARHPDLPVTLLAVPDGEGIDRAFREQGGEALLALTPTAAAKVASGALPPLQLMDVTLWRGFSAVVMKSAPVRTLADLKGRGFIVSGPTTGGRGGGPDLLFRAALARSGLGVDDLLLCYLPVRQGAEWLMQQRPLGDHANCEPEKDVPAVGMLLVEPAVSGLTLMARLPWNPGADARFDLESVFTGFASWPAGQFPLGGLAVRSSVVAAPGRVAALAALRGAYAEAIDEIDAARDHPLDRLLLARTIAAGFARHYAATGLDLPVIALDVALSDGRLRYRHDLAVAAIRGDLARAMAEVIGRDLPSGFCP